MNHGHARNGMFVQVIDTACELFGGEGIILDAGIDTSDEEAAITVQFGREQDKIFRDPKSDAESTYTAGFHAEQLEEIEALSAEVVAYRHFHGTCRDFGEATFAEEAKHKCMVRGCLEDDTHYTYLNIMGTVWRLRTCVAHCLRWDGMSVEDFALDECTILSLGGGSGRLCSSNVEGGVGVLLTPRGRQLLKQHHPEQLKDLSVYMLGWLDSEEGIPVDDELALERCGIKL